jgi:hypothetical protein
MKNKKPQAKTNPTAIQRERLLVIPQL